MPNFRNKQKLDFEFQHLYRTINLQVYFKDVEEHSNHKQKRNEHHPITTI